MGIEQLETSQYLVELDDEARRVYSEMASAEEDWLRACEKAGAQRVQVGSERHPRHIVCVPPSVVLPDEREMALTKSAWLSTAQSLATAQGKSAGIGGRSASLPVVIGGDDHTVYEVRHRSTSAYRGAKLSFDDAIQYIGAIRDRHLEKIAIAEQHYKHDRVKKYKKVIDKIDLGLSLLNKITPRLYSARINSGEACKITVKSKSDGGKKSAVSDSIPRIAIVYVSSEFTGVQEAPHRNREGATTPFMQLSNLVLFVPKETEFQEWEKDILCAGKKAGILLLDIETETETPAE